MAIEKNINALPTGMPNGAPMEGMDVNILNELSTLLELDDGSVEVTFGEEGEVADPLEGIAFGANLAEYMEDDELSLLGIDLMSEIDTDIASRKEWADTYVEGMDVLGLRYEKRTEPWPDACGAFSTVLAEAAIRFQAETMAEAFPASGPVKIKILGEETRENKEAGERVRVDMNHELTEVMVEYRPEHERMLWSLGLAGSTFKKVYFDQNLGRQTSLYVPAEDIIVPYSASNIESAERITHVQRISKNEMLKFQQSGFYRDIDVGEPTAHRSDIEEKKAAVSAGSDSAGNFSITTDERHTVYEVHVERVIEGLNEGDKLDENREIGRPYVIAIDKTSGIVLSIRRNWEENDLLFRKRQHFVHYVYIPGFGFYGWGLIHLVGGYAKAGTSLIRQLVDAGTLANLPAGLKTRGLRIEGDDKPIGPGEFKDVDVTSGAISDNIMLLPYKEPSQTLLALLDRLTEEGRRLGAISDVDVSDMSANAPVGTTLALLERTLKPMSAVQARVHFSQKQEFKLLHKIIAKHAPKEYGYTPSRAEPRARQADYALVEIIPVSDPNTATMAQRIVQYQAAEQLSTKAPQIYNLPYLHRQMLEVLGIKNAEKIIPIDEDAKPRDPVTENMDALVGRPMKAFINQDHAAHLQNHQAFMQDPMIMESIGQNPMGQQIMGAMQAHVMEHMGFNYRKQLEEQLGVPLPIPGAELPEEFEVELSQLMARAGIELSKTHKTQAAQQKAQQQAEDPILQIQRQELEIKGADIQRKAKKDADDKTIADKKLGLEAMKVQASAAQQDKTRQAQSADADKRLRAEVQKEILKSALAPKKPEGSNK